MLRIERFDAIRAGGVALALFGAVVLAAFQLSLPDAAVFWILLTLGGPVLLAIGDLYRTLRWQEGERADAIASGVLTAAAAMLVVAGFIPNFTLNVAGDSFAYALSRYKAPFLQANSCCSLLCRRSVALSC